MGKPGDLVTTQLTAEMRQLCVQKWSFTRVTRQLLLHCPNKLHPCNDHIFCLDLTHFSGDLSSYPVFGLLAE